MSARLNLPAIERFINSPLGPVARDIQRRAENVVALATARASGPVIGIESGALHSGIQYRMEAGVDGPTAVVFTPAMSSWRGQPFSYPAYHDQTGRPWLTGALRAAMLGPGEAV